MVRQHGERMCNGLINYRTLKQYSVAVMDVAVRQVTDNAVSNGCCGVMNVVVSMN